MSGHTPIPWRREKSWEGSPVYITDAEDVGVCMMDGCLEDRDPNAAFIVLAVNSHAELVSALETLVAASDEQDTRGILPADKGIALGKARAILRSLPSKKEE